MSKLLTLNFNMTMKKQLLLSLTVAMFMFMNVSAVTTPIPVITLDCWVDSHDSSYGLNVLGPNGYYDYVLVFDHLVTATGEGDVHLYLNGEEVSNPYKISHSAETYYQQFASEVWHFTATAQLEGCEMSETMRDILSPRLPQFYLIHDEESDSFLMDLVWQGDYSINYKTRLPDPDNPYNWISSDWEEYSGPFTVWYAPQDRHGDCDIEIMYDKGLDEDASPGMGVIYNLKDEIDAFGIYKYDYYSDGFFFCYGNFVNAEGICNKYNEPELHKPCYFGDLILPDYVSVIREQTFANCPDLTSLVFTDVVTTIGRSAFSGCTGLKSITCHPMTPPTTSNSFVDESIFSQVTLFVPYEALDSYRAHQEWGKFSRIVPFRGAGPGDANGDGKLSISDVTDIINQLLNDGDIPAYCDVNGDGRISIGDITALIDMLLRIE